jgi:uncharacterized membrane protein
MGLEGTDRMRRWTVNARSYLLGAILEATALLLGAALAWALREERLVLFLSLFAQGLIVIAVLYARVRLRDRVHEREREACLASMLRRAPI